MSELRELYDVPNAHLIEEHNTKDLVIQTWNEVIFAPFAPHPSMINLPDIAHALSLNTRFNGHTKHFYSIAQHSVYVAREVLAATDSYSDALCGLLHDASEAYIADLASPIKKGIPGYKEAENRIQKAICEKYGIDFPFPAAVHDADGRMLVTEARDLMPASWLVRHGYKYGWEPYQHFQIEYWSPEKAEKEFLCMFENLLLGIIYDE